MIRNFSVLIFLCLVGTLSLAANGDESPSGDRHHGPPAELKAAFDSCFTSLGIAKPEKGSKRMADADREKVEACVKAKGIELPKHGMHSHVDFEKMKACLASSGVAMPAPPSDSAPSADGKRPKRPELTDAQKKAMHDCHEKVEAASKD